MFNTSEIGLKTNVLNEKATTLTYKSLSTTQIVDIIAIIEDALGNSKHTDESAAKIIWDIFYPTSYGIQYSPLQLMQIVQHKPNLDKDSQDNSPIIMSITRGFVLCFAIMFKAGGGAKQFSSTSSTHSLDIIHDALYQQAAFKKLDAKDRRLCDFNESLINELIESAPAVFIEMQIRNLHLSANAAKIRSRETTPMSSPGSGSYRFKRNINGNQIAHILHSDNSTPNTSTRSSPVYLANSGFAQFDSTMGELFLDQMQNQIGIGKNLNSVNSKQSPSESNTEKSELGVEINGIIKLDAKGDNSTKSITFRRMNKVTFEDTFVKNDTYDNANALQKVEEILSSDKNRAKYPQL